MRGEQLDSADIGPCGISLLREPANEQVIICFSATSEHALSKEKIRSQILAK